jgi:hypothetical protein
MASTLRGLGLSAGRRFRPVIWPALASLYRMNPSKASGLMLFALGIADPSYRKSFSTLARVVDTMPNFDGGVIECGVYRGATLLGVAHRLALRGIRSAKLIGCDSFEGLPEPSTEDALRNGTFHETALKGVFGDTSYQGLLHRIERLGYSNSIRLCKGFFEETLPQLSDERFSIAHIDCDLYQSYVTCLECLYPRMVKGGYMIFDEYDFSLAAYPGAQKAIDAFFADKPEKLQWFNDLEGARCFIIKA